VITEKSGTESTENRELRGRVWFSDKDLCRVADKASMDRKIVFTNLLHFLTPERIEKRIKGMDKKTASGPDGMSRDETLVALPLLLPGTLKEIHEGRYKVPALRRVYIPKSNGKMRPLAIGNILDRGIQGAMAEILENVYEQDFLNSSFGFRPNRNGHQALKKVMDCSRVNREDHFLEIDLENFFGTMDHGWVLKFLQVRIGDKRVLKLIESWLKAGILENNELQQPETGAPQGGAISPLLSNVYLHYVLDLWFEKAVRPRLQGEATLVRFADDFLISFKNRSDLETVARVLPLRMGKFALKISHEKSKKTYLGPPGKWPDVYGRSLNFLGFTITLQARKKGTGLRMVFKTSKAKAKEAMKKMMHASEERQGKLLNAILRGHMNYYGLQGNTHRLASFRYILIRYWRRLLSRRTRDKIVSWDEFNKLLERCEIIPVRLRYTYVSFGLINV
jgi:RNA-directed DNA polymerase